MHRYPDSRLLLKQLNQRKDEWKLIYLDEVSLVYLKNIPQHQDIIQRYQVDLAKVFGSLREKADKRNVRYLVYLAEVAQSLGELREASSLYLKALEFRPQDPELIHRLGTIHYEAGRFADAPRLRHSHRFTQRLRHREKPKARSGCGDAGNHAPALPRRARGGHWA